MALVEFQKARILLRGVQVDFANALFLEEGTGCFEELGADALAAVPGFDAEACEQGLAQFVVGDETNGSDPFSVEVSGQEIFAIHGLDHVSTCFVEGCERVAAVTAIEGDSGLLGIQHHRSLHQLEQSIGLTVVSDLTDL